MDVSSQDPPLMAMDLSKSYSVAPLTRSHADAMDLAKKPEWYHRRPPSCGTDLGSPFRSRASSSYGSLGAPGASVHCRDVEQRPEPYMNSSGLYRDGVHGNLWHQGFYAPEQSGGGGGAVGPVPESSCGEESDSGSDVIFLVSSAKEPLLCGPFIQDGVRHIVEPLSPAVSSLDEGRSCYHLPQPLSSPSPDSSYSDDSSDSSVDIPVHHTRPVVLLSDLGAVYGNPAESPVDVSSDDSDVIEVSVTKQKKKSPPQSRDEKPPPRQVRRSSRIKKPASETPPLSCSGARHSLRRRAKNDAVGIYNESCDSDDMIEYAVRISSSDADVDERPDPASQRASCNQSPGSNSEESGVDVRTDRKSPVPPPPSPPPPQQQPHRRVTHMKRKKKKPLIISRKTKRLRSEPKQNSSSSVKPEQANKSANRKPAARRRKKRRAQSGPSAQFPVREPEITLKYAKIKEEKKEKKSAGFCPFVHMEKKVCTVVNYQEEAASVKSSRGGRAAAATASVSGFVPNTSCFQLGRFGSDVRDQATLLCCLCGHTANAMGLGDLHGPYQPAGPSAAAADRRLENGDERLGPANSSDDDRDQSWVAGDDSHPPPKVPPRLHECWIHEDCGIWSAGVFLVRGKLYGLEEAARLAQETVCSACQQKGAIMGCFQKGCARNYHYRCAIQSGCVLNEDNFSIRCPEHKNKLLTSLTRQHKR